MLSSPITTTTILLLASAFMATAEPQTTNKEPQPMQQATLGGGCFWCIEAVYQRVEGVSKVQSGYAGGTTPNPTYEEICRGDSGHAEVIQITFDPAKVTYAEILEIFWLAHDPTTPNRQGNDVGTQYRSIILTHSEEQAQTAAQSKTTAQKKFDQPIVTQIEPLTQFHPAEAYHQDYYNQNRSKNPYCMFVIHPKIQKLQEKGIISK